MCGICGIINFSQKPIHQEEIKTMMTKMKHRGPDDAGIFIDNNIGIGHVRLSIIDLSSAGHQPMVSDDHRFVISYNGEIYNYIELREELKKDFNFSTQTDTEVLLTAYRKWGKDCLHKLNGMFAFVIYDKKTKQLFGARDRFGIKPFYYYFSKDYFVFASDIPPILITKKYAPSVNSKTTYDYLVFGRTDHNENTFFDGIKKLLHGHCFTIAANEFKIERWYQLKINLDNYIKNPKDKFQFLLEDSIRLRLRSDVPVGVCLSGGLDSSSIVAVLNKNIGFYDLNTFSAVYEKHERADESKFIEQLRPFVRNMYYTRPSAETFINELGDLLDAHSEPFSTSAIYAQYKVMQLAKGNVKVLLDGQGADEHLAGYHYFFGFYFKELIRSFSFTKLFSEIYSNIKNTKSLYGLLTAFYFMLPPNISERMLNSKKGYLSKDFLSENKGSDIANSLYNSSDLNSSLLNHFEYKLEHLLKWEDRNSMWFSLESRVPFLDYRLVEFLFSLPSNYKIKKGETKYILKDAMKDIVPSKIIQRKDKIGFATPETKWLRDERFSNIFKEVLVASKKGNNSVFNDVNVEKKYQDFLSNKNNDASEIWRILNYNLWLNKYICS